MKRSIIRRSALLLLIFSLAAVLSGCSDIAETTLPPIVPGSGEYTVNEVATDVAGVTNEECGVTLLDDGTFQIYMGWGVWHEGQYEIQDGALVCISNTLAWDGGAGPGSRDTDVIFTFSIRSENLLELTDILIRDENTDNLIYSDGLTVGMTYSIH